MSEPLVAAALPIILSLTVFNGWLPPLLLFFLFASLELIHGNFVEPWRCAHGDFFVDTVGDGCPLDHVVEFRPAVNTRASVPTKNLERYLIADTREPRVPDGRG